MMFSTAMPEKIEPNNLVLRVQPNEGIELLFQTKRPGSRMCLNPVRMDFSYPGEVTLTAYERVLLDCMQGDQMLFVRDDGVYETWRLLSPVIKHLEEHEGAGRLFFYPAGSDGPAEAEDLLAHEGHQWRSL